MRKYLHRFDRVVMDLVARLPRGWRPFMLFASLIGHPLVTVGSMLGLFIYAVWILDNKLIILCCIALLTFIISSLMKIWLRRARPQSDYVHSMWLQTFSFPSGHATGSLVCFGLFAYLIFVYMPVLFWPISFVVALLSLWVGVSRVYLGAHYPSDVIGGWIVGGAGILCIGLAGV